MKYVLDASVALKWLLKETDSHLAAPLREQLLRAEHEFIAPDVFLAEVANALTRAERRRECAPGEAGSLLATLFISLPTLHESRPLMMRATAISSASRASVYDALYIALAEDQRCGLITADEKLIAKFPGFPIVGLASL